MTSEVTQALLPCPFCGGEAEMAYYAKGTSSDVAGHYVECSECSAGGEPFDIQGEMPDRAEYTKSKAVAAWNTRLTAQSGEGRKACSNCDGDGITRDDNPCMACGGSGTRPSNLSGEGRSEAGEDAVTVGLAEQVAEAMEDDGGAWRSCTGCHETNEGYSTGHFPYSAALKCELGSGCRECGGIGAVWDNTDYADMADFMAAADRDHANIKRILIENDIQPYRAEQIAMAITELEIPAALNARQSGEGEREEHLAIVECSDPNEGWSLSIKFGSGDQARDRMRALSDRLRAGEA